jgi:MtN3 and saliva related transmembrane protein
MLSRPLLEAIGSTAAFCTTISFLPQLIRVWRRKSASDISLTMFLLFSFGLICWLVYGIGLNSRPMIVANSTTLALALAILALKLTYDRKPLSGKGSSATSAESTKIEI